jgi:hypothetical protein
LKGFIAVANCSDVVVNIIKLPLVMLLCSK